MIAASTLRLTGDTTIKCRLFLGAQNVANGTLLVDRGGVPDATKRLVTVEVSTAFSPIFHLAES